MATGWKGRFRHRDLCWKAGSSPRCLLPSHARLVAVVQAPPSVFLCTGFSFRCPQCREASHTLLCPGYPENLKISRKAEWSTTGRSCHLTWGPAELTSIGASVCVLISNRPGLCNFREGFRFLTWFENEELIWASLSIRGLLRLGGRQLPPLSQERLRACGHLSVCCASPSMLAWLLPFTQPSLLDPG